MMPFTKELDSLLPNFLAMSIASFIVALSMKNGTILSRYCSGNPACSIKSLIIIPALLALISSLPSAIACKKYFAVKKLLK